MVIINFFICAYLSIIFYHYVSDFLFLFNVSPVIFSSIHFPPMYDNAFFYYSISFSIHILSAFNCHDSNYISHVVILMLLFVLFLSCACCFYFTVKMSYLEIILPSWKILFYPLFFKPRGSLFFTLKNMTTTVIWL